MNKINQQKTYKDGIKSFLDKMDVRKTNKGFLKNNKGITIITLVITIILMLILASITINMAINGGLFKYAGKAKVDIEMASEKETLQKAIIIAGTMSKTERITVKELQKEINNMTEGNTAIAMDNGDTVVVKFNDSNRYYEINNKGNITGPIEMESVEYPGDISKGGAYDGSEEKPFQISCIEDLVAFSIMTNGGNSELGLASSKFNNQYVILTRTLDFKSLFSYDDYTTTIYGDLNTDGKVEDIRTELTKTDEGCIGFNGIFGFCGIFDGNENTIENIYQKNIISSKSIGLFTIPPKNKAGYCTIKNLSLTGTIINTKWHAAGIINDYAGKTMIVNCKNYADVTGFNMVGGITDYADGDNPEIINCYNYGTITITGNTYQYAGAGGILGHAKNGATIKGCVNEGDVLGNYTRAGIVGNVSDCNIINCINKGSSISGIVDWVAGSANNIINCYNLGECDFGIVNKFSGVNWTSVMELNIKNCYNLGKVTNCGIVGSQGIVCKQITLDIENSYNAGESSKAILGTIAKESRTTTITNITNTYYDKSKSTSVGIVADGIESLDESDMKNNATFVKTLNNNIGTNTEWKHWKIGEDGWPTFE